MTYTMSEKKDVTLHLKFHAQKVGNAHKMPSSFLKSITRNLVWKDTSRGEMIVRLTRRDETQKRKIAEKVLDTVAEELGAVRLSTANLWSRDDSKCDKYQVLLFLKDDVCVGVLLAERILNARRVTSEAPPVDHDENSTDPAIAATTDFFPASIGISRIWTSNAARRSGIAIRLLDTVTLTFQALVPVRKDQTAFSQPTEMGARLARKWFGREMGWLVYDG
jgi:N-acetyltransferase